MENENFNVQDNTQNTAGSDAVSFGAIGQTDNNDYFAAKDSASKNTSGSSNGEMNSMLSGFSIDDGDKKGGTSESADNKGESSEDKKGGTSQGADGPPPPGLYPINPNKTLPSRENPADKKDSKPAESPKPAAQVGNSLVTGLLRVANRDNGVEKITPPSR